MTSRVHLRTAFGPSVGLWIVLVLSPATASAGQPYQPGWDFRPQPLMRLRPGTQVGDSAPAGWSYLIIKNQPRLDAVEAGKIHPIAADIARLFFGAILATVTRDPADMQAPYRLGFVAVGLGTNVGGQDVIISSQTQAAQRANLGFIARQVLSRAEAEMDHWMQVARSPTMMLFDAPTMLYYQGRHQRVTVRYAVLVDPRNGRLETMTWILDMLLTSSATPTARWMPQNQVHHYPLMVDANQVIAGIPTSTAFSMGQRPPGIELPMSIETARIAVRPSFSAEMLQYLEHQLWVMIYESARQQRIPTGEQTAAAPRP